MSGERKKIVIIGASGGSGEHVAHRLAREINKHGHSFDISLVTRAVSGADNRGLGLAQEIIETRQDDRKHDVNANVPYSLRSELHLLYDSNKPETLEPALKDADIVILATGLPRPNVKQGQKPVERSSLIAANSGAVIPAAKAFARYAPKQAKMIMFTNPLDNEVKIADDTIREEREKIGQPVAKDEVTVIGMGPSLDESRARAITAQIITSALKEKDSSAALSLQELCGDKITARVYGEHGPNMVIDLDSMLIKHEENEYTLNEFLDAVGLGNKKDKIRGEIKTEVSRAGGIMIKNLGRSAQSSTGERTAEHVVDVLLGKGDKIITASAVSAFGDDETPVAYGRPLQIGNGEITLADFPKNMNPEVRDAIHK